ncbi:response regulator transcription factor [Trinickia sp. NRRL B-1857]|uniref:response regulator transcription factor n=1 Tax=Trinickia sp. NRRL B-1857 TaxID=3162879 RepID=UPI003D2C021F
MNNSDEQFGERLHPARDIALEAGSCCEPSVTFAPLTDREFAVLDWLKEGKTNWEIGAILDISERTVKFHVANIREKLKASSRSHVVALAYSHNLVKR